MYIANRFSTKFPIMINILRLCKSTYYHRLSIRIVATENTIWDAWPGAVIRNNLLFAAEQVFIEKEKRTLRDVINDFPLKDTHPLYKNLKDGFPKGYQISLLSHIHLEQSELRLSKGEIISFSLTLIGNMSNYYQYFVLAIRLMCEKGLGKPRHPFLLIDISEQSIHDHPQVLSVGQTDLSKELTSPVYLSDFTNTDIENSRSLITIQYTTPIILIRPRSRSKKNTQLSYQDKCNQFPSFYQLLRSCLFRLLKLNIIYNSSEDNYPEIPDENSIESFLENAGHPILQSANIKYTTLKNTLKKECINTMPLAGYTGEQTYSGYFEEYLPLLKFMEGLSVGNETVYGMGRFEVEITSG